MVVTQMWVSLLLFCLALVLPCVQMVLTVTFHAAVHVGLLVGCCCRAWRCWGSTAGNPALVPTPCGAIQAADEQQYTPVADRDAAS